LKIVEESGLLKFHHVQCEDRSSSTFWDRGRLRYRCPPSPGRCDRLPWTPEMTAAARAMAASLPCLPACLLAYERARNCCKFAPSTRSTDPPNVQRANQTNQSTNQSVNLLTVADCLAKPCKTATRLTESRYPSCSHRRRFHSPP